MEILWIISIIFFILVDFFTSAFLFFGFSIGAIVALIMSLYEISVYIQVSAFFIIGIIFILVITPKVQKAIKRNNIELVENIEEKMIGRTIVVQKDIIDEEIMLLNGSYWTFKNKGEAIKKGDIVNIISIEGNKIIIKK